MRTAQSRAMQAYLDRNEFGLGDLTQQGAAGVVGSSLLQAGAQVGKVDPLAGAVLATAGALASIVSLFGPNPNNNYATEVVNQVEADVLQPNLTAWQNAATANKTLANQAAAVAVFNSGWAYVMQACNNPALGSAGINCIGDRQRGGKFDWFKLYLDPIATDPAPSANALAASQAAAAAAVAEGSTGTVSGSVDSVVSSITTATGLSPLMIGVGLIVLAFVMVGD